MTTKNKLLTALEGFEAFEPEQGDNIFTFENVSTGNFEPPAYIVAFLFLNILKYRSYGGFEKIWWHTYCRYKGTVFLLRDFKFGSWSLAVRKGDSVSASLVQEVRARIKSAANHADEILEKELRKRVNTGEFWIHNGYNTLRAAFDFYAKEVKEVQAALDVFEAQGPERSSSLQEAVQRTNEGMRLERVLAYRTFPLIVSFYSLLEFLLDTVFAFEQPAMSFFEFRRLSWQDRFKAVIPLVPGSDILKTYEKLVRVRSAYRNPLAHGLTNESSLLVPVPYGGLVPVSFEHLSSSVHFGTTHISPQSATDAAVAFDTFLNLISSTEPYAYYILYVGSGFSVPVVKKEIDAIRSEMTSMEAFDQYLQQKHSYHDAVINRDI